MRTAPSAFSAWWHIKRNRLHKKQQLYKLALGVSIDVTIAIYLGLFLLLGGFIVIDVLTQYRILFIHAEQWIATNYLVIVLILIVRALVLSLTKPGILFTSAELKLSLLPYTKTRLWTYCLLEKGIKVVACGLLLAVSIWLLTPLSASFLLSVSGLFILVQLLMMLPQWFLFQQSLPIKLWAIFIAIVTGGGIRFLVGSMAAVSLWVCLGIVLLIIGNLFLWKKALKQVDWLKVIQTNDLDVWNMWFINQVSKMEIKPEKRQGWVQQLFKQKKQRLPFAYQNKTNIYKRLWKRSFIEAKKHVTRTIGGICVLLALLSFPGPWLFGIGIVLAIFLFAKMAASFFTAGFGDKLIHSLPWDLAIWKKAFLYWTYLAGLFFISVLTIILVVTDPYWILIPLQLLLYIHAANYYVHQQLNNSIGLLIKKPEKLPNQEKLYQLLLSGLIITSIPYPIVTVAVLPLVWKKGWQKSESKAA